MKPTLPFAKLAATLYALLVALSSASAVYLWRLRCEGFGCTGIGVAWIAWAVLFLVVLVLGRGARHLARLDTPATRAVHWATLAQLALGAFLLSAWALHNAAA